MNITFFNVAYTAILIFFVFASLLFGFSLIGQNPIKIIKQLGITALIAGIIYLYLGVFSAHNYYYAGMLIVSVPIFKRVFKINYPFTIIAELLSMVLFAVQLLASQIISSYFLYANIYKYSTYLNLIILVIDILLGAALYWKKVTIFPENAEMYLIAEKDQRRKFEYNLLIIIFVLTIMLAWILYIIENLSLYPFNHQIYIFSFTIVTFALFVYFIKVLSFYAMERIEVLIDKQYQAELLGFMQIIRSQRHDFNFHLQAIFGMLDNKKYSECYDYVKTMVKDAGAMNDVLPLYHPAVGALLNTFREIAAQKGIQLEILIYYNLERIPCTVYEINKVIGNLVQNAIDEVEQNPGNAPWVQVMILKRGGNIIIKVSNKSSKDISSYKNVFNPGYSTKQSHEGIGLATVQKIVSRYNGTVYPEFEDSIIHFIAHIPIKY